MPDKGLGRWIRNPCSRRPVGDAIGAARSFQARAFAHRSGYSFFPQPPIGLQLACPHVDSFPWRAVYTKEESKNCRTKTRARLHALLPELRVFSGRACAWPVLTRAHSVAVTAEFEQPVSVENKREKVLFLESTGIGARGRNRNNNR